MKILIAGAGVVGTHLAKLLSRENHDIVLVDTNEERLANVENNFDIMTMNASPTSIATLKEAGAGNADLVVGVMEEESRNMTCCMLASKLGAKKTVARVDSYEYIAPEHKDFFTSVGINSMIYPEMLAAEEIVNSMKRSWMVGSKGRRPDTDRSKAEGKFAHSRHSAQEPLRPRLALPCGGGEEHD